MARFLLRRLLQAAIVLLVMSFVIYNLIGLMPGDPIDLLLSGNPRRDAGVDPTAAGGVWARSAAGAALLALAGRMLNNAQELVTTNPALAVYPGLLIFVTAIAVNFLGDELQHAFDPRS